MKIHVSMVLKKPELPSDNRPVFVSYIKAALEKTANDLYRKLYNSKTDENDEHSLDQVSSMKELTFSVKMNNPKFNLEEGKIELGGSEILASFSTGAPMLGIDLYNSLNNMKGLAYPLPNENSLTAKRIRVENHQPITSNTVLITMLSPLVVRKHEKAVKDRYYIYEDNEFQDCFFDVTKNQLEKLHKIGIKRDDVILTPFKPKKTVSLIFGRKLRCSLGLFKLQGDANILNLLYQNGIGSRRSQGCGMFEIVRQGGNLEQ